MKLDLLFPHVEVGKTPADYLTREEFFALPDNNDRFRIGHYLKVADKNLKCMICREPTTWLEINFEGPLCSEECDDKMWNDYYEACRQSDLKNETNTDFS